MVHVARRLVAGERLYVDVVAFTGPLPFEALAWLFRLAGDSLWVVRGAVVALQAAACAAAWGIGVRAGGRGGGHGGAACVAAAPVLLFPMPTTYFYSTLATGLAWLAAYAALRGTRTLPWAVAAGAGVALVALCKQTLGLALAASLLVALGARAARGTRLRTVLAFAAGGMAVAAISLGLAAWDGTLRAMVHSLVWLPLSLGETFRAPYPSLWPPGAFDAGLRSQIALYVPWVYGATMDLFTQGVPAWLVLVTQVCFALPPAALLATLGVAIARPLPTAAWIQLALLAALTTNLFPRADWGHVTVVLPAAAAQAVLLVAITGPAPWPRWRAAVATALSAALVVSVLVVELRLYSMAALPDLGPRVPLLPVSHVTRSYALVRVVDYLRENTSPGDPIFVARGEPLLYYATETRNPTPFGGVIPAMREEQEQAILSGLEEVRYVVMSDIDQPLYAYYRNELPAVQSYLERHFEVADPFLDRASDWIVVLERGADRGPTLVDLLHTPGRYWTRSARGRIREARQPIQRLAVRQNRRFLAFPLDRGGGGVDFDLEIPPHAVFQAGLGYAHALGDALFDAPLRYRMVVAIDAGRGFETLANEALSSRSPRRGRWRNGRDGPGRRWTPVDVDLARYAGRSVTLRLALVPESPIIPGQLGWFGSPRIARARDTPAAGGEAAAPTALRTNGREVRRSP